MPDEEQQQCVFCHIASGKIPAKKVYDDDKVAAVLDINPAASGHILLVPKRHVAIMPQMSDDLVSHLGMVAKQLSHALIRALKVEGTSIFVANGVAAGQRAPHFLLHVIPRKQDDNIALQPPIIKIDQKTSDVVYEKLADAVARQFGREPPKVKLEKPEKKELEKEAEKPSSKSNLDELTEFLAGGK
ncbi:MAG: HIT family protein [Candidatus Woesearchaeota archaeon]